MKKFSTLFNFFVVILLFFLSLFYRIKPVIAVQVSSCDVTQFDFTREYEIVGPLASTSCRAGDCETKRQPLRGTGNYEFTCWPQGKTPEDTSCPGRCTGVHPNFSCQQTGCTPVIGSFNNICTGCEVPATTASCGNPCNGPGDCPSTCGICDRDTLTGTKYCRVSPPGGGPTIPVYNPECTTDNGQEGVKTALGCLPTDPEIFVNTALPWAIGVGAGIAFLLGLFGAIIIVLSAGNPEKMQAGKEMITSAIAGLLLIIFAVLILNVVGVKVLNLFDFQEPPHPGDGGT